MQFFYVWTFFQIIFESLPVSSSGNVNLWMSILKNVLDFKFFCAINTLDFDFLLHGPTILIIAIYFAKDWIAYLEDVFDGHWGKLIVLVYCAWADLLTGVWFAIFKVVGKDWFALSVGFFVTSCALFSLLWAPKNASDKEQSLSLYHATILGMAQGVALLPGLSRFGMTYVVARHARYSSQAAFRYSFLLQMPLICAAFLKGCYSFYFFEYKSELLHPVFWLLILISTILSYFMFVWVGTLVRKNQMYLFGWYVLGTAALAAIVGK